MASCLLPTWPEGCPNMPGPLSSSCPVRMRSVLVLLAGCVLAVAGCRAHHEDEIGPAELVASVPKVPVTTAQLAEWARTVSVQGSLVGDEHAVVGARVAGQVKEVRVDLGSEVRQGDVLATLHTEEFDL